MVFVFVLVDEQAISRLRAGQNGVLLAKTLLNRTSRRGEGASFLLQWGTVVAAILKNVKGTENANVQLDSITYESRRIYE